jgi:hypothetical protein
MGTKDEKGRPIRPADKTAPLAKADDINRFLEAARRIPPVIRAPGTAGRLLFAMDATMSRQPTWDKACQIQSEMFLEADKVGGLSVQLAFFRGLNELKSSRWVGAPKDLARLMTSVRCRGGLTQIQRMLAHALKETRRQPVQAVVYVGDCVEENPDALCALAGELGMMKTPLFLFHEGQDPIAALAFREMARLSGGAYAPFDASSPNQLADLLRAVAVYAAGGAKALLGMDKERLGSARVLIEQIGKGQGK